MSKEGDVGVSAFVTAAPGFSGLLKHRFSDFMVNEIASSGAVVRLTDVTVPSSDPSPLGDDHARAARARLVDVVGEALVQDIEALAEPPADAGADSAGSAPPARPTHVKTNLLQKDQRKVVHEAVRALFPALDTEASPPAPDAAPGLSGIVVLRRPTAGSKRQRDAAGGGGGGSGGGMKFEPWPSRLPDYLSFTLHKRNIDTLAAVQAISEATRIGPRAFAFAGRKDRRGVTAQTVTAYRVLPKRLAGLNRHFRGDVVVGNFSFMATKARLGGLYGNRFSIVLRSVAPVGGAQAAGERGSADEAEAAVSSALTAWAAAGYRFINYFGLQRFGSAGADAGTHMVGRALVRQQWREAVELVLRPREGENDSCASVREAFAKTGDARAALSRIPRSLPTEAAILDVLASFQPRGPASTPEGHIEHSDAACAAACAAMPAPARALYVNAYQSLLWNQLASSRVAANGLAAPVPGDLVFADASSAAVADEALTATLLHEDGCVDSGAPSTGEATTDDALPSVRVLTAADVAAGTHSIADVVIPLPGSAVTFPEHECAGAVAVAALMRADGFVLDSALSPAAAVRSAWAAGPRAFTAPGGYRRLVSAAEDVRTRLVRHARMDDDLQVSDAETLLGAVRAGGGRSAGGGGESAAVAGAAVSCAEFPVLSAAAAAGGPLLAVQLCFSLRSSCYATMALREVMKQSTDRGHWQPPPPPLVGSNEGVGAQALSVGSGWSEAACGAGAEAVRSARADAAQAPSAQTPTACGAD